jgi:hypothetical protein
MGFFDKIVSAVVDYNPITLATDLVTGGKFSEEVLGHESAAGEQISSLIGKVQGGIDDISGKTAADAAGDAAGIAAASQAEQLAYLKEINKLPQEYREAALTKLAGGAGIGPGPGQQQMIDQAKASPLYSAIMEGQQAGEEAILRNAGATGGLRSGNVQSNLANFSSGLQNQALLQSYNQQQQNLQGLAGLDTGTNQIANTIGNIGQTQAAGITGAAQARQQGTSNMLNTALLGASLFI